MTSAALKVAVIGAGQHAVTTLYPAMVAAGYDIRAVVTRHLDGATAIARRFGGGRAFDSPETMLASMGREIEAIVMVLPPDGYEAVLTRCLPSGLPIYCEKPVALASHALWRIEDARSRSGSTIMVGYMKRFATAYTRAKSLIDAQDFGAATAYQAYWGMGPSRFATVDYFLRENATHHLDLARYFMGEVTELAAKLHNPAEGAFALSVLLRFAGGAVGTLQLNTTSAWDHDNEWLSVTGRGRMALVDNVETCFYRVSGEGERRWTPNYTVPVSSNSSLVVCGFVGALEHFAAVVRDGAACQSDLASALRTVELAERVLAFAGASSKDPGSPV